MSIVFISRLMKGPFVKADIGSPVCAAEQDKNALHVAACTSHTEAVAALVKGDRPSILNHVEAAICCRPSALIHVKDSVKSMSCLSCDPYIA